MTTFFGVLTVLVGLYGAMCGIGSVYWYRRSTHATQRYSDMAYGIDARTHAIVAAIRAVSCAAWVIGWIVFVVLGGE